jgi:tol-pal system protein YbgF
VDNSSFAANLQARLDEIETQIRGLTGKLEVLDHANVQSNQRLDKLVSDIDFRLKALETRGGAVASRQSVPGGVSRPAGRPSKATPVPSGGGVLGTMSLTDLEKQKAAAAGAKATAPQGAEVVKLVAPKSAPLPKGTPESQYKFATNLLFQSDFSGAEKAFAAFIAGHPKHKLAGNAQYWLAETFYVRKDFRSAARAFAEGYQRYPQNQKGPDNLLKLGMSLGALGKKQSACATFTRLLKDFPKAGPKIKSRTAKQRKKYSCRR